MKKVNLIGNCVFCDKEWTVEVNDIDVAKYEWGALAQDAFPYLTPTERECIISGMCPTCQAKIFGERAGG